MIGCPDMRCQMWFFSSACSPGDFGDSSSRGFQVTPVVSSPQANEEPDTLPVEPTAPNQRTINARKRFRFTLSKSVSRPFLLALKRVQIRDAGDRPVCPENGA